MYYYSVRRLFSQSLSDIRSPMHCLYISQILSVSCKLFHVGSASADTASARSAEWNYPKTDHSCWTSRKAIPKPITKCSLTSFALPSMISMAPSWHAFAQSPQPLHFSDLLCYISGEISLASRPITLYENFSILMLSLVTSRHLESVV